ncbi:dynein axonemal intermediate chain 3 [Nematolebias whitei]|uniref:dynein axonemal intermediate chain 3 n=1 Tax=Nematolebias whitei TaxID=451745 RepID=UPI00189BA158|nr:dynein axonemal intermediate chain 3 [Nematolebias whitei]
MALKKGKRSRSRKGKNEDHPEDIFPLVLTSATQKLFDCRADEDVTEQSPYKLLKKDDIIQDIKTRAAVSDFSPVKQILLNYPEEEILLVFDSTFTYDQNFYLVLSPEAKNRILNVINETPETETAAVLEVEVNKTPKRKPWVSLGSENEIEAESIKETRPRITIRYFRKWRTLKLPVNFSDSETVFVGFESYEDKRFNIKVMLIDRGVQAVPVVLENSTQTPWIVKRNNWTHYEPREFSEEEKESILQSESMKNFCKAVTTRMLQALQEESIFNVFIEELKDFGTGRRVDDKSGLKSEDLELQMTFKDHTYSEGKKISSVHWHPIIHGMIAVALTEPNEEESDKPSTFIPRPSFIVFYSFADFSKAQLLLESPDDVVAFEFCPSNPNIIVGGCVNGQVAVWDISAHSQFLHSGSEMVISKGVTVENKLKVSVQVLTCSPDGTLKFWDVRLPNLDYLKPKPATPKTPKTFYRVSETFKHLDRTWKPFFTVYLFKVDDVGTYSPWKFCFHPYTSDGVTENASGVIADYRQLTIPSSKTLKTLEDVNTKIYVGTLQGEIVCTDWKEIKPLHCFNACHGMVHTVQRSPFLKDVILTIGIWKFAISKEGVMEGPVFESAHSEEYYCSGCWSLTRPAVFFIGRDNGSIEVWNLLEDTTKPSQVYESISKNRITCIKPWTVSSKQHFLAVTDDLGVLRVFEMSEKLCIPSKNESLHMKKYLEHETEATKYFAKQKKTWAKQKKEEKEKELEKKMTSDKPVKTPEEEEKLELKEYKDFLMLEESILKKLGVQKGEQYQGLQRQRSDDVIDVRQDR